MFYLNEILILLAALCLLAAKSSAHHGFKRDAEENDDHLLNILKDHEIIPDLIDDAPHADILEVESTIPYSIKSYNWQTIRMQVSYGDDIFVNRGDELTPTEVREQPLSLKWSADPTLFYTLLMIGSSYISACFRN